MTVSSGLLPHSTSIFQASNLNQNKAKAFEDLQTLQTYKLHWIHASKLQRDFNGSHQFEEDSFKSFFQVSKPLKTSTTMIYRRCSRIQVQKSRRISTNKPTNMKNI
jgi:hypothetical protein